VAGRDLWCALSAVKETGDASLIWYDIHGWTSEDDGGQREWYLPSVISDALLRVAPSSTHRVTVPIRLESEANLHEHWRGRQRRAGKQHADITFVVQAALHHPPPGILHVVFTRRDVAGTALDRGDNTEMAFKHVRDALARWLGHDDADPRIAWGPHRQEIASSPSLLIEIRSWSLPDAP
jgi:hypothetical protein